MNEKQAVRKLLKIYKEWEETEDNEKAHGEADSVIADFLESLGYTEIVNAYHEIPKWYA